MSPEMSNMYGGMQILCQPMNIQGEIPKDNPISLRDIAD